MQTIPLGYGDGITRSLSNKMSVIIGGVRCLQLGRVTMDQILVDATDVPATVRAGTEVSVIGAGVTAEELAADAGTINYEIVTQLSKRIHREAV